MNITSTLKIATGSALFFAGSATLAKDGRAATALAYDVRPANAQVKVSANSLRSPPASEKSQGMPNADGEKPGNGNGYGHLKGVGRGHEIGLGHGHDSDPESP